ncbi:NUDIX hydrolase [Candidatus Parcubacteria bacterium]|jgi:8-oxo-dGTP diphosphatase|nr:NUDIX hydrolase [Candidatus Parcubacteria bacterium]MBT3949369.1 NUDIX hydrolase [Candidatus Parcubacteria bacterium]
MAHPFTIPVIGEQKYAVICADIIIENDKGEILIEKTGVGPMTDKWILSGGCVHVDDDNIQAAALRSVKEEVGLDIELTHLVDVFGNPEAKPVADTRFYAVQVLYTARPKVGSKCSVPTETIKEYKWIKPESLIWVKMGFNHKKLVKRYLEKKRRGELMPADRSFFSDHFGKDYSYESNDYMHTIVMGIALNEDNEVLLAHRAQNPFKGHWDFPGGHMYVHESIEECLKREVMEELGVECEMGNLFQVYSDKGMSPRFSRAMVLYFIKIKSEDFVKNIEMDDFKYFPLYKLPDNLAYHVEGALSDIKKYIDKK